MGQKTDRLIIEGIAWNLRDHVSRSIRGARWFKADAEIVEDAISYGLIRCLENASQLAKVKSGGLREHVFDFMRTAAMREARRLCRARDRTFSLDAPMPSSEEQDADWNQFVVYETATVSDAETHCDAMKVARLASKLSDADQRIFMMAAEGMTAEEIASELGVHPSEARKQRARVTRLIGDSFFHGDDAR